MHNSITPPSLSSTQPATRARRYQASAPQNPNPNPNPDPDPDPNWTLGFGAAECLPIAPGINATVTWHRGNPAALVGRGVRLAMRFRAARLFAFQFFD